MTKSAYSREILNFIDAESSYFEPITPAKFVIAGDYYADLAIALDYSTERWLRNWLNESYGENKVCEVPHDWQDWLVSRTQQSVSVNFLQKYLPQTENRNNYPEQRESGSKPETIGDLVDDDLNAATAIASVEDITAWGERVALVIRNSAGSLSFSSLRTLIDLKPVEIYLGILLNEQFQIVKENDDFYGDFIVMLN